MNRIFMYLATVLIAVSVSGAATPAKSKLPVKHHVPGEVLPELKHNVIPNAEFKNGLKNWKIIASSTDSSAKTVLADGFPALQIHKKSGQGFVAAVSSPFSVKMGTQYLYTSLYHCSKAAFGVFAEFKIITATKVEQFLKTAISARKYAFTGRKEVYSRPAGEWVRVTNHVTPTAGKVCAVIVQYGEPSSTILYSSLYMGENKIEKRAFDKIKYNTDNDVPLPEKAVAKILSSREPASAEVVTYGDVPAIKLNGRIAPPLIYFGDAFNTKRSKLQDFQKAGVSLQIMSLNRNRHFWKGKDDYDLEKVDRQLKQGISRNPQGNFIVLIDVSPYPKWSSEHPEHVAQDARQNVAAGRHGRKGPPSYWSEEYRTQACKYVEAVVKHLKEKPYYNSIAGFFIAGNEDGQFYYNIAGRTLQDGHAPAAVTMFRKWLKKQYGNIANLRQVWNSPDIEFDKINAPIGLKPYKTVFFDPSRQMAEIDFIRFLNESMAMFANRLCMTAKANAGKKVLSVMWWGRGASQLIYPHYGQSKVIFPSAALDLMGAQSGYYGERENACSSFIPWVSDSARLHNKLMMLEADYRTWLSPYKNMKHDFHVARYWNMYDLKGALLREFGKQMAIGGGLWWYDMHSGWFKHPGIMDLVCKMRKMADTLYQKPVTISPADIVLVADEQNFYTTTEQADLWNGPNYHALRLSQRAWLRSGLKYDMIYFNDLVDKKLKDYKVYVFLNQFAATNAQKSFINKFLKRKGKLLVWLYAPGYLTKQGLSLESMKALTGVNITQAGPGSRRSHFLKSNSTLTAGLATKQVGFGLDMPGLRFAVNDPTVIPLACYDDSGEVSAAIKENADWKSLYIAMPSPFSPDFIQNLARYANIHVYNTPGDMFCYHRDDFICLHGVEGNENHISLPVAGKVEDLLTNQVILENGQHFSIKLKPGETRLLRLRKP